MRNGYQEFALSSLLIVFLACSHPGATGGDMVILNAGQLRLGVDSTGRVVSLGSVLDGREYVPKGHRVALLHLVVDGKNLAPTAAAFDATSG